MVSTLITNIGEFFTGDIERPVADVASLHIEDGRIKALNPAAGPGRTGRHQSYSLMCSWRLSHTSLSVPG